MKLSSKTKERLSVGLDIGTQSIKFIRLRCLKDAVEVLDFSFEANQLDSVPVLKKIAQAQNASHANISVSGLSTVIRYITFPKMNITELRQALKFEAQKHIPFSVSDVNLDTHILKDDLPDNKMLILIAAVKKEMVSQRLKTLEDANIRPGLLDIDSLALVNAFNFDYEEVETSKHKALALLNIGATASNLNILENKMPRLSRDIHIAGNNFTQKVADVFSLDFKSAENLKLSPDTERLNKVNAAVESVLTNLAGEIRTSFDYYESQNASSVAKIFLSGGGSNFNGLKDMLTNLLGIEVEYWDPLKKMTLSSKVDPEKIKPLTNQLAVAMGLALR